MAQTIEDVNSRTLLQQFHSLYKKVDDADLNIENLETDLENETQNRTNADYALSQDIADLQEQIDTLGNVFTLKGSVDTIADLPASDNTIGDVYYVKSEHVGYVWIDDEGTERWEQLGETVDLSNYVTQDDLTTELANKQDTLTAGTNVSILGNVISMIGKNIQYAVYDTSLGETNNLHITNQSNGIFALNGTLNSNTKIYYNGESGVEYFEIPSENLTSGTFYYLYVTKKKISLADTWLWYIIYVDDTGKSKFAYGKTTTASGTATVREMFKTLASDVNSESATQGQVLTADGNGGASWQNASGGASNIGINQSPSSSGSYVNFAVNTDTFIDVVFPSGSNYVHNIFIADYSFCNVQILIVNDMSTEFNMSTLMQWLVDNNYNNTTTNLYKKVCGNVILSALGSNTLYYRNVKGICSLPGSNRISLVFQQLSYNYSIV